MNQRRVGRDRRIPTGTFTVVDDDPRERRSTAPGGVAGGGVGVAGVAGVAGGTGPGPAPDPRSSAGYVGHATVASFAPNSALAPNTLIGMTAVPQALLDEARARRGSHMSPPSYEQLQASMADRTAIIRPEELQPLNPDEERAVEEAGLGAELGVVVSEASAAIDALETPFIGIEEEQLDQELRARTGPLAWDPSDGPVPWEVVRSAQASARAFGQGPRSRSRLPWLDDQSNDPMDDTEISIVDQLEVDGGAARNQDGIAIPIELSEGDFEQDTEVVTPERVLAAAALRAAIPFEGERDGDELTGGTDDTSHSATLGASRDANRDANRDARQDATDDEITQVAALARHAYRPVAVQPAEVKRAPMPPMVELPDLSRMGSGPGEELTVSETLQALAERTIIRTSAGDSVPPFVPPEPSTGTGLMSLRPHGVPSEMVLRPPPVPRATIAEQAAAMWNELPELSPPALAAVGAAAVVVLGLLGWALFGGEPDTDAVAVAPVVVQPEAVAKPAPAEEALAVEGEEAFDGDRQAAAVETDSRAASNPTTSMVEARPAVPQERQRSRVRQRRAVAAPEDSADPATAAAPVRRRKTAPSDKAVPQPVDESYFFPADSAPPKPRAGRQGGAAAASVAAVRKAEFQVEDQASADAQRKLAPPAPPVPAAAAPDESAIAAAIEKIIPRAMSCVGDGHGQVQVTGTVVPTGRVSHALISGEFAGTPEGSCIARAVRTARLSPFEGAPTKFGYVFEL